MPTEMHRDTQSYTEDNLFVYLSENFVNLCGIKKIT